MRSLIRSILMLAALAPAAAGAHEGPTTGTAAEVRAEAPNPTIEKWAARFKGSVLLLDQSVSAETVAPAAQLSYIPSYQWWFSLRPRYYFTPKLSFRLRLDLTLEWLNAEETTLFRHNQFGEVWTDLVWTGMPKLLGIETAIGLRAIWGTSQE